MDIAELIQDFMCPIAMFGAWAVCFIIRQITEKADRFIPLIAAVVGLVLVLWINAFAFSAEVVVVGLISGLAATGLYEAIKNLLFKNEK